MTGSGKQRIFLCSLTTKPKRQSHRSNWLKGWKWQPRLPTGLMTRKSAQSSSCASGRTHCPGSTHWITLLGSTKRYGLREKGILGCLLTQVLSPSTVYLFSRPSLEARPDSPEVLQQGLWQVNQCVQDQAQPHYHLQRRPHGQDTGWDEQSHGLRHHLLAVAHDEHHLSGRPQGRYPEQWSGGGTYETRSVSEGRLENQKHFEQQEVTKGFPRHQHWGASR